MYRGLYQYFIDAKCKTGNFSTTGEGVRGDSESDAVYQYEQQHPDMIVIRVYQK